MGNSAPAGVGNAVPHLQKGVAGNAGAVESREAAPGRSEGKVAAGGGSGWRQGSAAPTLSLAPCAAIRLSFEVCGSRTQRLEALPLFGQRPHSDLGGQGSAHSACWRDRSIQATHLGRAHSASRSALCLTRVRRWLSSRDGLGGVWEGVRDCQIGPNVTCKAPGPRKAESTAGLAGTVSSWWVAAARAVSDRLTFAH